MQKKIVDKAANQGLSIENAATKAQVSSATIRNWIKTGYLIQEKKGIISQDSLESFLINIAGKEKLNSRANKQLKDTHNHEQLSNSVALLLRNAKKDEIGTHYENSLSNAYRNKEGIYYTPQFIIKDMLKDIEIKNNSLFLDPCCGSGNFIIEALRAGIAAENIYGFDSDKNAILITQERIKNEFGTEAPNIKEGNFLQEAKALQEQNIVFDYIFTNPPWGKKLPKTEKEKYAKYYDCGSSLDTTSLFMGASFTVLKNDGILGFLIQEAFFNISTFEYIRKRALSKKILRLIDYGKPFKGLITKAQTILIKNTEPEENTKIECFSENLTYFRTLKSFKKNPKNILNFWANENDAAIINQLYTIKHTTLQGKAKWALGIVTGNNERFCSNKPTQNYIPIYKGADITKNGLKKPSLYITSNFETLQQVAPLEMYKANEKIIYKFIASNLCFYHDQKQQFILNSANMLLPNGLNITTKQLTDLLNSEIINWLFKKLFSTHKVLRGDLELLPIHTDYFLEHTIFNENNYLKYLQIISNRKQNYQLDKKQTINKAS